MVYVGIDLHRKRSHVAVVDAGGQQLLSRRLVNDPDRFRELLGELGEDARFALEATYGWEWLAELLEAEGCELHLAHPLRTKAIASARVKTDAVDEQTLAQLLHADLLPEAYIAPRELRDLRDLLRQRFVLTQMRSALTNRVHALIARQGVQHGHSRLLGPGGRVFLAELELRPERVSASTCCCGSSQTLTARSTRSRPRSISAPSPTSASGCCVRSAASGATWRC
jgi:transposase